MFLAAYKAANYVEQSIQSPAIELEVKYTTTSISSNAMTPIGDTHAGQPTTQEQLEESIVEETIIIGGQAKICKLI